MTRWRAVAASATVIVALFGALPNAVAATPRSAQVAQATQEITVDGRSPGRVFDGIGALSAGASSRLLIDYPEPQRSQVLDYLFKPGYGAALQILRVEIGGDSNSTDGAEPSHMHSRDEVDCGRGYEWWLMREARKRNPRIQLGGLAWGAPGWFTGGFWSQDNIDYNIRWLECARKQGLTIDYLGGWNESEDFETGWFVDLKKAMRANGFTRTKLIAADGWGWDLESRWKVAEAMKNDPSFYDAVDIAAVHYPCGGQYNGAPYDHCPSTQTAQDLGKPLWSGEQGSQKYDIGAGPLARAINRSYIDGKMTATVNWSAVASFYGSIPYAGTGLLRAYQPWSGYFEASRSLWPVAHTTQFTEPGWRYLDTASGYLSGGGSYTSLRSPRADENSARDEGYPDRVGDYSTVFETIDAETDQTVRLNITGGLASERAVQIWDTDLTSSDNKDWFRYAGDVEFVPAKDDAGGTSYEINLKPGHVYTVSTKKGAGKGLAATPNADRAMPLPYQDDFERLRPGRTPRYLSDFNGAFETAPCTGRRGQCVEQKATTIPIWWRYAVHSNPVAVLDDPNWWGDYAVSVDTRVGDAPSVDLLGRVDGVLLGPGGEPGYRIRLEADGTWTLIEFAPSRKETVLASGKVANFDPGQWHRLGLSFHGTRFDAFVDGQKVAEAEDSQHNRGLVGIRIGDWRRAQFDNLSVTRTARAPELIPQNRMRATASNAHLGYEAGNALDAAPATMWHTTWTPPAPLPQSITLDLGRAYRPRALLYTPRFDGNLNATVTSYALHASVDGRKFTPVCEGTWAATSATKVEDCLASRLASPVRFLKLEVKDGHGFAGAAELNVAL